MDFEKQIKTESIAMEGAKQPVIAKIAAEYKRAKVKTFALFICKGKFFKRYSMRKANYKGIKILFFLKSYGRKFKRLISKYVFFGSAALS